MKPIQPGVAVLLLALAACDRQPPAPPAAPPAPSAPAPAPAPAAADDGALPPPDIDQPDGD
ncbi:hypothetical protein LL974_15785, partial [Xanthomonas campestris pv. cannae]|nr:hypothetical protein [Xanthomonas campestris pv. cannae]